MKPLFFMFPIGILLQGCATTKLETAGERVENISRLKAAGVTDEAVVITYALRTQGGRAGERDGHAAVSRKLLNDEKAPLHAVRSEIPSNATAIPVLSRRDLVDGAKTSEGIVDYGTSSFMSAYQPRFVVFFRNNTGMLDSKAITLPSRGSYQTWWSKAGRPFAIVLDILTFPISIVWLAKGLSEPPSK